MNIRKPLTTFLTVFLAVTGFSQPVMASDDAMICAVTKGVSCFKQSECTEGTATDINMPILMKINPKNKGNGTFRTRVRRGRPERRQAFDLIPLHLQDTTHGFATRPANLAKYGRKRSSTFGARRTGFSRTAKRWSQGKNLRRQRHIEITLRRTWP